MMFFVARGVAYIFDHHKLAQKTNQNWVTGGILFKIGLENSATFIIHGKESI